MHTAWISHIQSHSGCDQNKFVSFPIYNRMIAYWIDFKIDIVIIANGKGDQTICTKSNNINAELKWKKTSKFILMLHFSFLPHSIWTWIGFEQWQFFISMTITFISRIPPIFSYFSFRRVHLSPAQVSSSCCLSRLWNWIGFRFHSRSHAFRSQSDFSFSITSPFTSAIQWNHKMKCRSATKWKQKIQTSELQRPSRIRYNFVLFFPLQFIRWWDMVKAIPVYIVYFIWG